MVEGSHEESFFRELLKQMNIGDIQIASVGGADNFAPSLKRLPTFDNFDNVASIGIVRDADNSFSAKFRSIANALRRAELPRPTAPLIPTTTTPKVMVYIAPDNSNQGALEDLCLATVAGDPVLQCVDYYFDCIRQYKEGNHPHLSKARVQAYLASKDEGDVSMARAALSGYWDFNSSVLNSLKQFLNNM